MTQLNLITTDGVPCGVTIAMAMSPVDPTVTLVDVRVLNAKRDIIASYGARWTGLMPEYLPQLAYDVACEYLWSEGARCVVAAARKVANEAKKESKARGLA